MPTWNMLERLVRRKAIPSNLPALSLLVGISPDDYMLLSMARLCISPHSALDHPPVVFLPLTALCLAIFLPFSV